MKIIEEMDLTKSKHALMQIFCCTALKFGVILP